MNLPLPAYAAIKDKTCIAYLGHRADLVRQLEACRPLVEAQLPGLSVYLCLRPELASGDVIPPAEIEVRSREFGYVYEVLDTAGKGNPVKKMMDESELSYPEEIFCPAAYLRGQGTSASPTGVK
jgi:hypothetical protein